MAAGKRQPVVCIDCGTRFATKAARTDHEKHCPVSQSQQRRRIQEQLEWKHARLERRIHQSYQYAARAFTAYHNGHLEQGRRLHGWLAQDFASTLQELEPLHDAVMQAGKVSAPRINKLSGQVVLSIEQVQELRSILARLNRDYGEAP